MSSAWAERGWQGDTACLKDLARHAGSLAAKNVTLAADRDFHLNEVVQIPDDVGPFQLPLLARQTVFQFLAHLLHHAGGSGPFPIGCNFENGLVTRFLSA